MAEILFLKRLASLLAVFLAYILKRFYIDAEGKTARLTNPLRLRLILEEMGGLFLKFGQILAARFDLFPPEYAETLLELDDKSRAEPNKKMFKIFQSEIGKEIHEVFDDLDEKPLAVSFFSQVYKGKLDSKEIIVKVQKPDIVRHVAADLALLRFVAFFIDGLKLLKSVSMKETIRQLEVFIKNKLDYKIEARNNRIICEHAKKHELEEVIIPKTHQHLTTKKILTQEFLSGAQVGRIANYLVRRPIETKKVLDDRRIDVLEAANRFVRDLMRQYFIDKFFHADPRPDNLIIFPESKIGFIDFSLVGRPSWNNFGLLRFLKGAAEFDFWEAALGAASFLDEGLNKEIGSVIEADLKIKTIYQQTLDFITKKLARDLVPVIKDWHAACENKKLPVFKRSAAPAFLNIANAVRKYKLNFPPDAIAFLRALAIVDVICLKLSPEFSIFGAFKSFFERHSLDDVKAAAAEHEAEISELGEFSTLRFVDIAPEKAGILSLAKEEKMYAAKEKFLNFVSALAEKYPELYTELKEAE